MKISEQEIRYRAYLIRLMRLDIDDFIDTEYLSFEEFCKREGEPK